jgi:radical SAM superfamily enzyme YgiQ (UPF0313 family)
MIKEKDKRIFLISSSFEEISLMTASSEEEEGSKTGEESHYPLGMAYLHAYLESLDYQVESQSLNNYDFKFCFEKIKKCIKEFQPHIVGLQILSVNRVSSFRIIEYIHENYPEIQIVMGGIHVSILYESILEKYPYTIAVIGEGEITFGELADALFKKNISLENINGIAFYRDGKVIVTPQRELIADLDILPFPKHEIYFKTPRLNGCIMTSRGCPFKCSFCALDTISRGIVRYRSIKNVVDEIQYMIDSFPQMNHIWIHDDTFLLNNKRVMEFCDEIKRRNIKIDFICSGRMKPLSAEMIKKMEEANFKLVCFGLESGDNGILEKCHKGITQEDAINAFHLFKNSSIIIHPFLIVGLPGENERTILETSKLVQKLQRIKYIAFENVAVLSVYPGTEVYEIAKANGMIDDSFWLTDTPTPLFTIEHSPKELFKFKKILMDYISYKNLFTFHGLQYQFKMLPYIRKYLEKNQSSLLKLFIETVFPKKISNIFFRKSRKNIPLIKETAGFEAGKVWSKLPDKGIKKIFLYGAGQHTKWLLEYFKCLAGPEVVSVLDDNAEQLKSINDIKVILPEKADIKDVDAIVLSTDRHQKVFAEKCVSLWGNNVMLIDLYEKLMIL